MVCPVGGGGDGGGGGGTELTVTLAVALKLPPAPVHEIIYIVVTFSGPVDTVPDVLPPVLKPPLMQLKAFCDVQVS